MCTHTSSLCVVGPLWCTAHAPLLLKAQMNLSKEEWLSRLGEFTVQFSFPMGISAKMNLSFSQKLRKKWNLIILIEESVVKDTVRD